MRTEGDPIGALLRSRKFLLLILDTVVSAVLFFVGRYALEATVVEVTFVVGVLQPVFVAIITAIAREDAAEKAARPTEIVRH
jgi:hypothetical protein